ncbi:hypothetical protein [Fischerella sp.]|nr:hypothetical protein [Fischerella sp.]
MTREAVAITDEHRNETKAENGGYVRSKFGVAEFGHELCVHTFL